jgi:biopolymer transport protein TolR
MQRHRKQLTLMSDINVTNLLDTAFLLLITFMVVAPQLNAGIKVNTPKVADRTEPLPPKDPKKTVMISIEKANSTDILETVIVTYGGSQDKGDRVEIKDLKDKIHSLNEGHDEKRPLSVIVESDEDCKGGTFVRAMAAIKAGGVSNIGISTRAETKTPPATNPNEKKPSSKTK